MTISRILGHAPAEGPITKFGVRGHVVDVCVNFFRNWLSGSELRGAENRGLPLTFTVALTTGQHYRAACDRIVDKYVRILQKWNKCMCTADRFIANI